MRQNFKSVCQEHQDPLTKMMNFMMYQKGQFAWRPVACSKSSRNSSLPKNERSCNVLVLLFIISAPGHLSFAEYDLRKLLKPQIRSISPNWPADYGFMKAPNLASGWSHIGFHGRAVPDSAAHTAHWTMSLDVGEAYHFLILLKTLLTVTELLFKLA